MLVEIYLASKKENRIFMAKNMRLILMKDLMKKPTKKAKTRKIPERVKEIEIFKSQIKHFLYLASHQTDTPSLFGVSKGISMLHLWMKSFARMNLKVSRISAVHLMTIIDRVTWGKMLRKIYKK